MPKSTYTIDVFINCPFDAQYQPLFEAIVFAVFDCGFRARCALELEDSAQVRIDKVFQIISECRYGVHDISRTDLDANTSLPRFNMPLELGMFLAAKRFGSKRQQQKVCLVLDSEPYRYQQFISDIAGQDIRAHGNDFTQVIRIVRNWLQSASKRTTIPGGAEVSRRYGLFRHDLPVMCGELRLREDEFTFIDLCQLVEMWLRRNA